MVKTSKEKIVLDNIINDNTFRRMPRFFHLKMYGVLGIAKYWPHFVVES